MTTPPIPEFDERLFEAPRFRITLTCQPPPPRRHDDPNRGFTPGKEHLLGHDFLIGQPREVTRKAVLLLFDGKQSLEYPEIARRVLTWLFTRDCAIVQADIDGEWEVASWWWVLEQTKRRNALPGRKLGSGTDTLIRHMRDVEGVTDYNVLLETYRAFDPGGDWTIRKLQNAYARGRRPHAAACEVCKGTARLPIELAQLAGRTRQRK